MPTTALIADDHPAIIQCLIAAVNQLGFIECESATNSVDFHRLFSNKNYDLVISDLHMPPQNSIEFLNQIKDSAKLRKTILYTAYPTPLNILDALKLGLGGMVAKNESFEVLFTAIEKITNGEEFYSPTISDIIKNLQGNHEVFSIHSIKSITAREREVLAALTQGLSQKEIAKNLFISPKTVDRHLCNLVEKLNLGSRRRLMRLALSNGFFSSQDDKPFNF